MDCDEAGSEGSVFCTVPLLQIRSADTSKTSLVLLDFFSTWEKKAETFEIKTVKKITNDKTTTKQQQQNIWNKYRESQN